MQLIIAHYMEIILCIFAFCFAGFIVLMPDSFRREHFAFLVMRFGKRLPVVFGWALMIVTAIAAVFLTRGLVPNFIGWFSVGAAVLLGTLIFFDMAYFWVKVYRK